MNDTGGSTNPDEELFCSIYERFMPILRVLAKRYGVPIDEIDDIVQETFLAYYSHYPLTWPDYKVRAMLCRILKNRSVDLLRRKETHPLACWDPAVLENSRDKTDQMVGQDTLSFLLEQQEYEAVWSALRSMRKDWAQVFYLYVIEERPIEEVSRILGTTDAACRTRLTRGRKYLREKLKEKKGKDT